MIYKTIEVKFWNDKEIKSLSIEAKFLFIYLMTNRQTHYTGLYEIPLPIILYDTNYTEAKFNKAINELEKKPLLQYDRETDLIWIVNMCTYSLKIGNFKNLVTGVGKNIGTLHRSFIINAFHSKYKHLGYAIPMGYEWVLDPLNTVTGTGTDTVTDIVFVEETEIKNNQIELSTKDFEALWLMYPKRDGRKVGKAEALKKYLKLKDVDIPLLSIAVYNLAKSDTMPKDFHRFIKDRNGEPFRDWIEVAEPEGSKSVDKYRKVAEKLSRSN